MFDTQRRHALKRLTAVLAGAFALRAQAADLTPTPAQTEGPYYPTERPASAGNDLRQSDSGARAEGTPLDLRGRIVNTQGDPLVNARVEIWQADHRGIYRHPRAPGQGQEDPHFAGFGATAVAADGRYMFKTIVPVPYTGRPPHIHVKVFSGGAEVLTTQLYIRGHADNERGLFQSMFFRNSDRLLMTLEPAANGAPGRQAQFDLVV